MLTRTKAAIGGVALLASAATAGTVMTGATAADQSAGKAVVTETGGRLNSMNNSNAAGEARVVLDGRKAHVRVEARRLAKNLPHAQHIHFGKKAQNECPGLGGDKNNDFRITTAEGQPAYRPVRVSLTTRGDTPPASVLAVTRYPTAEKGTYDYERTMKVGKNVARGIRNGNAVVVVHGVDYNANGAYDFDSAGASELDPSLPAEATDPALCGVLRVK